MPGKRTKTIIALLIFVCLAPSVRAESKVDIAALERSAFERLFNHKLVNVVDDFLAFWDQARDKPLRSQRRLWRRMVESRHRDYFERAVYRGADRAQRRAMLDEFLIRVPERVDEIRALNRTITNRLLEAFVFFKDFRFREYRHQQDIYLGFSFFRFDGAVRPVHNADGIPDTLCLGAEVLAGYSHEQMRMTLLHEFFHLYHFGFLFEYADGISPERFRVPYLPLLIEGMAVAGTEAAYPGRTRSEYLHFTDEELTAQEQMLAFSAARFLDLVRLSAPPEQYERWFTQGFDSQVPARGGYLLGYEVAKRMSATHSFEQMVRMSPAELRQHAEEQLEAISGSRVFLFTDPR